MAEQGKTPGASKWRARPAITVRLRSSAQRAAASRLGGAGQRPLSKAAPLDANHDARRNMEIQPEIVGVIPGRTTIATEPPPLISTTSDALPPQDLTLFKAAFGSLKGKNVFGDAVAFQRKMRDEWD